ncbi:hypothetical protein NMY22_g17239 [Coprinellus aureogranulatus]|nr:hypothetical protein NMY22_g17239 [Coprinellus aureogranulatus]
MSLSTLARPHIPLSLLVPFRGTSGPFPEVSAVYIIPELICEITTYLDWPTLMALAKTDTYGRAVARFEVRARIRFIVSPFIPPGSFNAFIDLMARTGAGLVGSAARSLITLNADFVMRELRIGGESREMWIWPDDLNIAVRPRYKKDWVDFLDEIGYKGWWNKRVASHMNGAVHSVFSTGRFAFVGGDKVLEDVAIARIITCKRTPIEMAFTSIFSVQTNIITATGIYCFFPKLTVKQLCIRNEGFLPGYPLPSMWHCAPSNEWMEEPCGEYCPVRGSLPTLEEDSAEFIWNTSYPPPSRPSDRSPSSSKLLSLIQQFYPRCHNRYCINYQPHPTHLIFNM